MGGRTYRHPDEDYARMTKRTLHQSVQAFIFQMLRKISFFYQDTTLRMYTGEFQEFAAVCMSLLENYLYF